MLAGCGSGGSGGTSQSSPSNSIAGDSLNHSGPGETPAPMPTSTPMPFIPSQIATPTPRPTPVPHIVVTNTPSPVQNCVIYSNSTTWVPPASGTLAAPYGPAPVTSEAQQLTGQLFQLINQDRAACGLPPFAWNSMLAAGALLHSWNMVHCGFSHYCPDGMSPYQRIADEGYAGYPDCGE